MWRLVVYAGRNSASAYPHGEIVAYRQEQTVVRARDGAASPARGRFQHSYSWEAPG